MRMTSLLIDWGRKNLDLVYINLICYIHAGVDQYSISGQSGCPWWTVGKINPPSEDQSHRAWGPVFQDVVYASNHPLGYDAKSLKTKNRWAWDQGMKVAPCSYTCCLAHIFDFHPWNFGLQLFRDFNTNNVPKTNYPLLRVNYRAP